MTYIGKSALFDPSIKPYYYSTAAHNIQVQGNADALWHMYLDAFFGSSTSATSTFLQMDPTNNPQATQELYTILRTSGAWPVDQNGAVTTAGPLTYYKDYFLIQGMYGTLLRNFFYNYAPQKGWDLTTANVNANSDYINTRFNVYLNDVNRDSVTNKQNTIFLWLWQLLTQMLERIDNITLAHSGFLLAMTQAELVAANNMAAIHYSAQSDANDYATQASNMNLQKSADVQRSYRSADGKNGQISQSMMTQLRDQATQQVQLMTAVVEGMEAMYQAIMKK